MTKITIRNDGPSAITCIQINNPEIPENQQSIPLEKDQEHTFDSVKENDVLLITASGYTPDFESLAKTYKPEGPKLFSSYQKKKSG